MAMVALANEKVIETSRQIIFSSSCADLMNWEGDDDDDDDATLW